MELKTTNKQEIVEVPWGVYLWQMPDGSFVSDGEGHFLMISSTKGNRERMDKLAKAARACGVEEGWPCYFPGNRIVTDEEYEEQKLRMDWGLVPDPLDVAAIEEDRRNASKRR